MDLVATIEKKIIVNIKIVAKVFAGLAVGHI